MTINVLNSDLVMSWSPLFLTGVLRVFRTHSKCPPFLFYVVSSTWPIMASWGMFYMTEFSHYNKIYMLNMRFCVFIAVICYTVCFCLTFDWCLSAEYFWEYILLYFKKHNLNSCLQIARSKVKQRQKKWLKCKKQIRNGDHLLRF